MLVASLNGAAAQSIDPRVLQQLQGQLQGTAGNPGAALDASRQTQQAPQTGLPQGLGIPQGRLDTPEEQLVRRAEARRTLDDLYRPSAVERDYRQRLGIPNLRQFGYDSFSAGPAPTGVVTGAVGDDYVLGIGDEIVVSFQGATNETRTVRVDRDGRLIVGALRPIPAAGRSLGSVRNALAAETRRTLLATDIYLSVGSVRAVSVFVGGEVERPGQYSLTSVSDVATALAQAGGIRRTGTLRQVRVYRAGGGVFTADLYGLLGIGGGGAPRLRDGDRIIVPVIGPTIAVTGAVARPGIYEVRGATSVGAAIAFAGGPLRQRGAEVTISRITPDGSETFVRAPSLGATVLGGDAVQLFGGSAGGAIGRVTLQGNVENPGPRPLTAAPTIADLVGSPQDLRADTYQLSAILQRRDPITGARVFEPINLATALRQRPSPRLRSEDRLYVLSQYDVDFVNSAAVRRVALGQPNPLPQCISLARLSTLVRDTQSTRFNTVTRGSFVIDRAGQAEIGAVGGVLAAGGVRRADEAASVARVDTSGAESLRRPPTALDSSIRAQAGLTDQATTDRANNPCPPLFEDEPDLLPVVIETSVSVGGAVRRPGAYPVGGPVSARDLATVADGLVSGASELVLDINRVGGAGPEQVPTRPDYDALATTLIRSGDDIRFNAAQPQFETSGVLLSGEVARPGLYSIRRGETYAQLLRRAGGVSTLAYPYGTVFTRRSVREQQQEGFRRTARELNNSLLAVTARKAGSATGGDSLAGAAALIQTISQTEAAGRIVLEGDPRVLDQRPDLDTVLEPGDAIFVPKRPNFVLALGDVNNPSALQHVPGKTLDDYVREAGGTLSTADRRRIFVVLPNGAGQPLRGGGWSRGVPVTLPPGSTIIVPKNIDPLYTLDLIQSITTIVAQVATSIGTIALLATR